MSNIYATAGPQPTTPASEGMQTAPRTQATARIPGNLTPAALQVLQVADSAIQETTGTLRTPTAAGVCTLAEMPATDKVLEQQQQ